MRRRVRDAFNMADKNGDNALDMEEIMKLLKRLNCDTKKKYVQEMFDVSCKPAIIDHFLKGNATPNIYPMIFFQFSYFCIDGEIDHSHTNFLIRKSLLNLYIAIQDCIV